LLRVLPVTVYFARLGVAVLAVRPAGFRVVEPFVALLAGPIRQWLIVNFGVVLSHPTLARKRLPAGRTVHTIPDTAGEVKSEPRVVKVKLVTPHFGLDVEQPTDVVLGVETVGTLWFAVDDGVQAFGDGLVDDAL